MLRTGIPVARVIRAATIRQEMIGRQADNALFSTSPPTQDTRPA